MSSLEPIEGEVEVVWDWPMHGCVSFSDEKVAAEADEWLTDKYDHYDSGYSSDGGEWYVIIDPLSTPESDKFWDWLESQPNIDIGEA